ncbi:MAG: hypothetical protein ACD_36C00091G0001, partial [uncultured bacterium]
MWDNSRRTAFISSSTFRTISRTWKIVPGCVRKRVNIFTLTREIMRSSTNIEVFLSGAGIIPRTDAVSTELLFQWAGAQSIFARGS